MFALVSVKCFKKTASVIRLRNKNHTAAIFHQEFTHVSYENKATTLFFIFLNTSTYDQDKSQSSITD